MDEILEALAGENPQKAISELTLKEKNPAKIELLRQEYNDLDRTIRPSQVGQIQKDKVVKGKRVKAVRIPLSFQNRIVSTSTAFEVGAPMTLTPEVEGDETNKNGITREVERLMKVNRLDNKFQKAIQLKKSETQSALLFYIEKVDAENSFNRQLPQDRKKEIKCKVLENKKGRMAPYFDSFGDMKAFTWQFDTVENSKTVKNVWVYTDRYIYRLNNKAGLLRLEGQKELHDFTKIPIVYFAQDKPEWYVAQPMIDRIEVALSKLGASNDYSGHPILKLYGEVQGAPDKDEDGKALRFNTIIDEDTMKPHHGDAKFLTHDNAPESVGLELDRLEKYIYTLTSTPDISLENLKSIGDISGVAIKLMFLDAIMKSKLNEGDNRTAVERMVNIMVSGIVNTTITSLRSEAYKTFFDVQFGSILPDDLKESVESYARAVEAGIMSTETAIAELDLTPDAQKEFTNIKEGQKRKADLNNSPAPAQES